MKEMIHLLVSFSNTIEGKTIESYHSTLSSETIIGVNIIRESLNSLTDVMGGHCTAYEVKMKETQQLTLDGVKQLARNIGANALIDVDVSTSPIYDGMFMCVATGTAVTYK
ncbi:hypothetical protein CW357_05820 [Rummeliibacillus sp. TYF005]|nr:hypothetical protein CW357_05820 [Rummeliibacillus sp. TYF005]